MKLLTSHLLICVAMAAGCGDKYEEDKVVCQRMLDCAVALDTSSNLLKAAYGQDGTCWDNKATAELCAPTCQDTIDAWAEVSELPSECDGVPQPGECDESKFPQSGSLAQGDYAGCDVYVGKPLIAYFPEPTCSDGQWQFLIEVHGQVEGGIVQTAGYSDGSTSNLAVSSEGSAMWTRLTGQGTDCFSPMVVSFEVINDGTVVDCLLVGDNRQIINDMVSLDPTLQACEIVGGWTRS